MCVDYDPPEFFHDETRRAAKEHRCGECYRIIAKGESYHLAKGLSEGRWWTAKQCAHCEAASEWLRVVCAGFLYNDVAEELREHTWEPYPIATPALERLCDAMADDWAPEGALLGVEDVKATVTLALIPWRAWNRKRRGEREVRADGAGG